MFGSLSEPDFVLDGLSVKPNGSVWSVSDESVLRRDPLSVEPVVEGVADCFEPSEVLVFGSLSAPDLVLDGLSVDPIGPVRSVSDESVLDLSFGLSFESGSLCLSVLVPGSVFDDDVDSFGGDTVLDSVGGFTLVLRPLSVLDWFPFSVLEGL